MNKKIKANKALYINLGSKGKWVNECITENKIKIGFDEIPHSLCKSGKWEELKRIYLKRKTPLRTASDYIRQIKLFYKSSDKIIWIIFHNDQLWWSYSDKKIIEEKNGRSRKVIGKWANINISGEELGVNIISSKLKKIRAYKGTICEVQELKYLLSILNGDISVQKTQFILLYSFIKKKLKYFIQNLDPADFEILVDLIFRNLGYQRMGILGKNEKLHDLILKNPLTNQKISVQIKSSANLRTFLNYKEKFDKIPEYSKSFFVVHTPNNNLKLYKKKNKGRRYRFYFIDELVDMSIKAGLIDWLTEMTKQ